MPKEPREVPKLNIEGQTPITGRIAYWAENTLMRSFGGLYNGIIDSTRSMVAYALEQFLDLLEEQSRPIIESLADDLLGNSAVPSNIKKVVNDAKNPQNAIQIVPIMGMIIAAVVGAAFASIQPYMRLIQYQVEKKALSFRPSPSDQIVMRRLGAITDSEFDDYIGAIGVNETFQDGFKELTRNFFNEGQLANAFYRDLLSGGELDEYLTHIGYNDRDKDTLRELIKVIPPIQDLIQMGVREAWDDEVALKFGYDNDFSQEFGDWAEKQGLDQEWTKRYWRAHWVLPGLREGYEMFHRRIITQEELEELLRIKDVPSFWRDALIQLSYRVITRVDVRRMYEIGVVNQNEVYETYLDLGYKPEDAEKLTNWTIAEYGQASRELTKSDVINSFVEGIINEAEVQDFLMALNYGEAEIALLLARANLKRQEEYEKEFIENVRLSYIGNEIDENGALSKLNTLDPPEGFVSGKIAIWQLQKERSRAKPSKTELKQLYQADIIGDGELTDELLKQGYTQFYIDWYIDLWGE